MNRDTDIDRVLDEWLGAGPSRVSDRVFDMVAERIERQGQRPSWRLNWRETLVTGRARAAVVSAMAIAVAAVLIFAISRSHNPAVVGASPTPTASALGLVQPSPSPTALPTPTAYPTPNPDDSSAPVDDTTPPPAIYRPVFDIPMTITLSSDWTIENDSPTEFQVQADLVPRRSSPPPATCKLHCGPSGTQVDVTIGRPYGYSSAAAFLNAYGRTCHSFDTCLGWSGRKAMTEAGLSGIGFSFSNTNDEIPLYPTSAEAQALGFSGLQDPSGPGWFLVPGESAKVFVADASGSPVVITVRSSDGQAPSTNLGSIDALLKTLRFQP
jgi:hypothetical protein